MFAIKLFGFSRQKTAQANQSLVCPHTAGAGIDATSLNLGAIPATDADAQDQLRCHCLQLGHLPSHNRGMPQAQQIDTDEGRQGWFRRMHHTGPDQTVLAAAVTETDMVADDDQVEPGFAPCPQAGTLLRQGPGCVDADLQ